MDHDGAEGTVVLVGRIGDRAVRSEAGWVWNRRVFEVRGVPVEARSVIQDWEAEMVWQDAVKVAVTTYEKAHQLLSLEAA
jgi:hypothetical protein